LEKNYPSSRKDLWLALIGVGSGVFMSTLDSSIVNITLPTLAESFQTTFANIQWVVLSYLLVLTSLVLGVARLGDMYNKKRIYLTGMILFAISSLLCGLAPNINWLIGLRAIQGLGAVLMQALGMAIVTQIFPANERGRVLGIMGGIVSIGIAIGPPLGGLLISLAGWQSVFWVNVPVGILASFMVINYVPDLKADNPDQRFDYLGAVIVMVMMTAYALGMTYGQEAGFSQPRTLILLATALVGLILFLAVERRVMQPMVDLKLFENRLFGLNLLMGLIVFIVLAGNFVMPFFLELVKGYPAQQVGWLLMAFPVTMGLVAPIAGMLSDRFGSRGISLAGLCILLVGCIAVSTLNQSVGTWGFILRVLPMGLGFGLFQSPNNSAIMGSAPKERLGVASGLLSLSRMLGQTSGVPLMGALFSAQVHAAAHLPASVDVTEIAPAFFVVGFDGTYRIAAVMISLSILVALATLRLSKRQQRIVANPVSES